VGWWGFNPLHAAKVQIACPLNCGFKFKILGLTPTLGEAAHGTSSAWGVAGRSFAGQLGGPRFTWHRLVSGKMTWDHCEFLMFSAHRA
ncbi:MAG: hypothetical protein KGS60_19520, partial [Verrucomicrobia bacterium]|nr:hypothetical protein [Verrucomicrobiota bacterium]